MYLKIGDYVIIIFFLTAIVFSFQKVKKLSFDSVEIVTPYKKIVLPLGKNRIIKIKGKLGYMTVEIYNKMVRVKESNCPNKICVKTGWISHNGEYIACVPNGVLIKLIYRKKENKNVDFITK